MTTQDVLKSVAEFSRLHTDIIGILLALLVFLIMRGHIRAREASARLEAELRALEEAFGKSQLELQRTVARERMARTQVQSADRSKDAFLATISHELRTPINTILGWLTMLRTGSMRDDQRPHALEVIERNARLQAQLIEDLLDVSRIVTGKLQLALRPLAIAPAVTMALESLRPAAEAKGVTLHPPVAPHSVRVWGDPSRVQQILWNLLSNAIKFTPSGGHVSVEITEEHHRCQICVRDSGVGISPEFLPHVFERFRQADSSFTRAHSGLGLGLALVRDLVELHGGSIEAHSDGPSRGAWFVVRLSAVSALFEAATATVDALRPPALTGVRVLVVDDDAETRDLLLQALSIAGAHVATAESARRAFEQLRTEGADVLVSDIGMPDEDGFSLMRRIRSLSGKPGQIPAVALTAHASAEDRARAMEAGYQMLFAKPLELTKLQAGLARLSAPPGRDAVST